MNTPPHSLRIILLHCFGRTSQERWYQAVGQAIMNDFVVVIPDLPRPDLGLLHEWLPALKELKPDSQTVLVGHSLGGALILRYLETAEEPVAGFYTVAAPITDLERENLKETGFFDTDFDWQQIKSHAGRRVIIASTDDETVPFAQARKLTKELDAELVKFSDKGHFKQDDFPELVTRLSSDWAI